MEIMEQKKDKMGIENTVNCLKSTYINNYIKYKYTEYCP